MLKRVHTRTLLTVALLSAALAVPAGVASAHPHHGHGGVTCTDLTPDCNITVGGGGSNGSGGTTTGGTGSGGTGSGSSGGTTPKPKCVIHVPKSWAAGSPDIGEVPCYRPDMKAWFNPQDECYWNVSDPQPTADSPDWEWGNAPADPAARAKGKVYNVNCPGAGRELAGGTYWRATPPPGFGGAAGPTPAEVAQMAYKKMRLLGANIATAPGAGKTGIVGMPVWIWNVKSPTSWGPVTQSATAGGITIVATAYVDDIVYTMGDGGTVTCESAGTPYDPAAGGSSSPDCGYRYTRSSRGEADQTFKVSAVTTWHVHWEGGGQKDDIYTTRASDVVGLTIAEAQVVAKP